MKRHIPNSITLLNLFFGCCAIASVLYGQFIQAVGFNFASLTADYLDGTFARWLKAKSDIGGQLDSLADVVSFGVFPGAILYILLAKGLAMEQNLPVELTLAASPAFIVTLFAALRLAVFNTDERQKENFVGLPTPACSLYVAGLLLIFYYNTYNWAGYIVEPLFLIANIGLLSWLMVAELPMFSLKFRNFSWKENRLRFVYLGICFVLVLLLREAGLSFMILFYVLLSLGRYILQGCRL